MNMLSMMIISILNRKIMNFREIMTVVNNLMVSLIFSMQENQITAVPETFESSDLEQITVPLPPTRSGCERRRPQHLQDYSL